MSKLLRLLLVLAGVCTLAGVRAQAQVVIIANANIKATAISKNDVRDIFSGASSSFGGSSQVTPVLLRGGPLHEQMLELYIGKSDTAFRAGWRSLLFSGEGVVPKSFDSEAALVEYVAHTPGAVGYIGKLTPHDGVKILAVR